MKQFLLATVFLIGVNCFSQTAPGKPCSATEASQFDFWLGDWNLSYNDTSHAFNSITKEMGTCVIHEHFKDPKAKYFGESWSVYNPKTKQWQQTWVDTQGGYIILYGSFENGQMLLYTDWVVDAKGNGNRNRMLYSNITTNAFDWDWASTNDDGKTWKSNWKIHYQRAK